MEQGKAAKEFSDYIFCCTGYLIYAYCGFFCCWGQGSCSVRIYYPFRALFLLCLRSFCFCCNTCFSSLLFSSALPPSDLSLLHLPFLSLQLLTRTERSCESRRQESACSWCWFWARHVCLLWCICPFLLVWWQTNYRWCKYTAFFVLLVFVVYFFVEKKAIVVGWVLNCVFDCQHHFGFFATFVCLLSFAFDSSVFFLFSSFVFLLCFVCLFQEYTGGKVLTVYFAVIIGAFAIGQTTPGAEAVGKAQVSGTKKTSTILLSVLFFMWFLFPASFITRLSLASFDHFLSLPTALCRLSSSLLSSISS